MASDLPSRWPKFGASRWSAHDYASPATYFITICTHRRNLLFKEPACSEIVEWAWAEIPRHFPNTELDVFVVMPNHVHGVLGTSEGVCPVVVPQHAGALRQAASLSTIVRSFKAAVTRELRIQALHDDAPVWQPNYYDRVVRDEAELNRIREYIALNPLAWHHDRENPDQHPDEDYERAWGWLEGAS